MIFHAKIVKTGVNELVKVTSLVECFPGVDFIKKFLGVFVLKLVGTRLMFLSSSFIFEDEQVVYCGF